MPVRQHRARGPDIDALPYMCLCLHACVRVRVSAQGRVLVELRAYLGMLLINPSAALSLQGEGVSELHPTNYLTVSGMPTHRHTDTHTHTHMAYPLIRLPVVLSC